MSLNIHSFIHYEFVNDVLCVNNSHKSSEIIIIINDNSSNSSNDDDDDDDDDDLTNSYVRNARTRNVQRF